MVHSLFDLIPLERRLFTVENQTFFWFATPHCFSPKLIVYPETNSELLTY
jgi:hypothetical protein